MVCTSNVNGEQNLPDLPSLAEIQAIEELMERFVLMKHERITFPENQVSFFEQFAGCAEDGKVQ